MTMTIEQQPTINQESLATLREDGILLDGEHLALKVDVKIDAGQELNAIERRILWLAITDEQVAFVKENLL
ncbi:MAG TPA: hypothetical protein VGR47_03905 [Terracidiphilus sp.]|nr:hypothetical protein [Terracidiphilus sp.]